MADADAQTPEPVRAELLRDVLQAVVAGDTAAQLELCDARREIELVVHDQDFLRLDLVEARERSYRLARDVHVSLRQQEPQVARRPRELAEQPVILGDRFQLDAQTCPRRSCKSAAARATGRPKAARACRA